MRVYLDGAEVGALTAQAGSRAIPPRRLPRLARGQSEHFQGGLDDLRIYPVALDPEEIADLHEAGATALDRLARELADQLALFYHPEASFAATLARCGSASANAQ